MPVLPFGEFRPDVSDYQGQHTKNIVNVVPRGDGYGPVPDFASASSALPAANRGYFYARKNDGSIQVFAGTSTRLWTLNNTTLGWTPVSKVTQLTSISNATPAVFALNSHGLSIGDAIVLSTTGALPTGLTVGTVYYVISAGFGANAFEVSTSLGGSAVNTSGAGSGNHSFTAQYAALGSTANWDFAQFNNFVIAVQVNCAPQVYDLTTSAAFADLGGSPPQAAYISIVNRFLVLSGIASPNVYRIQWSGLNATTTWTSGVNSSDYQDLPDGGIVRGLAGGEFGIIFQDSSIRRMTFAPGSPYIFGIERISQDDGIFTHGSMIAAGDRIFFCSPAGFKVIPPGGYPTPIGKEKVDRTFFADVDTANLQLMCGSHDPKQTRVYWAYKSINGQTGLFDKILCYDWVLDKWSTINMSGEFLASLGRPGITLEGVDTAYGTNIDTIILSSLDDISVGALASLSMVNSSHKLGFFTGSNLEATLETPEQGADGRRIWVDGIRPVSDAVTIYGSISKREAPQSVTSYSTETQSDVSSGGQCPSRVSTRYARGKIRIPSQTWTYALGVEPEVRLEGER